MWLLDHSQNEAIPGPYGILVKKKVRILKGEHSFKRSLLSKKCKEDHAGGLSKMTLDGTSFFQSFWIATNKFESKAIVFHDCNNKL
jgi:hypothetical protein